MKKKYFSTKDSPQYELELSYIKNNPIVTGIGLLRWGYEDFKNTAEEVKYHSFPFIRGIRKELIGLSIKKF